MSLGVWKGRKQVDSGVTPGGVCWRFGTRMESWSVQVWGCRPGGTGLGASLPLSRGLLPRFGAWGRGLRQGRARRDKVGAWSAMGRGDAEAAGSRSRKSGLGPAGDSIISVPVPTEQPVGHGRSGAG